MNSKIISMALVIVMMTSILAPVSASFSNGNESVRTSTSDVGTTDRSGAQSGDFTYTANETAVTITGYTGSGGNAVIPDTIEGKPVEVIGSGAFQDRTALKSLIMPDGVIEIGSSAFQGCYALTSVTIPNSVNIIGNYAFRYCSALTSVILPDSVDAFGNGIFYACSALTSVIIPSGITAIGAQMFRGCSALTSVIIPSSIAAIGNNAFQGCTALTSITILNSITTIGSNAFNGCSALTSITIPNGVETIGNNAFQDCTALKSVTIGSGITSIGTSAFSGCTALTVINVDANNEKYASVDGILYNKTMDKLILCPASKIGSLAIPDTVTDIESSAFRDCIALTSIIIPSSVTTLGGSAFQGCTALTSVIISNGVITIGAQAFYGCTALTSINIPNSVETIGNSAFYGCTALTSVTIPNSVETIGGSAFQGCTALTSVIIGSSVTSITRDMFSGCTALTVINVDANNEKYASVDGVLYNKDKTTLILCPLGKSSLIMPNTLKTISDNAFSGCTRLVSIQIPDSVETIGNSAFYGCTALTSITIPNGITTIGSQAFQGCSALTSITIPNGVETIGNSAFYGCTALTSVTIPNGVTTIGSQAFLGCTALTSVIIGSSVITMGVQTFYGCTALTSVTIPNSVETIGGSAFQGCTALTSVIIGSSVTSITRDMFSGCTALTVINVDANNEKYASVDGVLYNKDKTTLILCPLNKIGSLAIPNSVTTISASAFSGCTALTSITIPNGVETIGNNAFYGCTALTSINIPNSVESIGDYILYGCTALTSVTIGSGVTSTIVLNMFSGCTALTEIIVDEDNTKYSSAEGVLYDKGRTTLILCPASKSGSLILPSTLNKISDNAFSGCTRLVLVQIPNGVTTIGSQAFLGCTALTSISIPGSIPEIGASAFSGCTALTSVVMGEGVETIGIQAFLGCTALTEVVMLGSVKKIDSKAFQGCIALTTIEIPSSVTAIGAQAFYGCTALTSVDIPDSVTAIGLQAFSGCTALSSVIIGNGVKSTGNQAFQGCTALTSVTIGSSVTAINYYAFQGCTALASVDIPDSVADIGVQAFAGCTALTSVTIGNGIVTIDAGAFNGCAALVTMIFEGDAPTMLGSSWSAGTNNALVIFYRSDATGFTSSPWNTMITAVLGSTPTAPSGLTVTPGDQQATLTWSIPSHPDDGDIDHYVIYQDNAEVGTSTSTSVVITGLTNGQSYSFKVAAHSTNGIGQMSNAVSVIPSAIIIQAPGDGSHLNTGTITIEWSFGGDIDDLDHFVIVIDNGEGIKVSANELSYLLSLSEGTHIVKITAIGNAGIIVSNEVSFVVDTAAPTVVITSPTSTHIASSSVTLSWTAEDLNGIKTLEISTDGTTWVEIPGTDYTLSSLTEGTHTVYVRVTDNAGNQAVEQISFVVDTVKPTVVIISPNSGIVSKDSSISVVWIADGATKTEISTDGTTWTKVSGTSYTLSSLNDGAHTVYVRVTDQAGNSEQASISFVVDTAAPTITAKSPTGSGAAVGSIISITFSEQMDASSVAITVDGAIGTVSWNGNTAVFTPYELRGNTEYTVAVTGKDPAGNSVADSWTFTTTNLSTVSGVIKDKDGNVVAGAKVTLKGATTKTVTTGSDGKYVFNDVAIGEYTLTVEKDGFDTYTENVKVTSGSIVNGNVVDGTLSKSEGSDSTLLIIGVAAIIVVVIALGALLFVRRKKGGMNGRGPETGKEAEVKEKK